MIRIRIYTICHFITIFYTHNHILKKAFLELKVQYDEKLGDLM